MLSDLIAGGHQQAQQRPHKQQHQAQSLVATLPPSHRQGIMEAVDLCVPSIAPFQPLAFPHQHPYDVKDAVEVHSLVPSELHSVPREL